MNDKHIFYSIQYHLFLCIPRLFSYFAVDHIGVYCKSKHQCDQQQNKLRGSDGLASLFIKFILKH